METRIKEFIDMEQLVFTQDSIIQHKLSKLSSQTDLSDEAFYDDDGIYSSSACAALDARTFVPEKFVLYYEVGFTSHQKYLGLISQTVI